MSWRRFAPAAKGFLVCWLATVAQADQLRTLPGHVPAAAARLQPLGSLADSTRLNLAFSLPLRNRGKLSSLLQQIYDPASPLFHRYLTPSEFTEQFGPTRQDYQAWVDFARAHRFKITRLHSNRTLLDVSATVSEIRQALGIDLKIYQHPSEARTFYAPAQNPKIPVDVPLLAIKGLDNYFVPHPDVALAPRRSSAGARALAGSGPNGAYEGNDFRAAYVPGVSLDGAGQTVALVEFDGYHPSDIARYESSNSLPAVLLTNVLVGGFSGAAGPNNLEVALDIEMLVSIAPGLSKITVYEEQLFGPSDDILNRIATDDSAEQISCSWNFIVDAATDQIFQEYAAQGQSIFCSSGDYGAYVDGQVTMPAGDPYVTSVGGTDLSTTGAGGSWLSETAWSGSGGGFTTNYPIPNWQSGINMTSNQASPAFRNLPDVAMCATNVYVDYNNGASRGVYGTSCAAPLWAGFTALVNQQAAAYGNASIGFLNPALYAIGAGADYAADFHDITVGNNTNADSPNAYFAVAGYDLCTGWGTPNGSNLINALAPPDTLVMLPVPGFVSSGPAGGPFSVTTESFLLTNEGSTALSWSLQGDASWLSVMPTNGTLNRGGNASVTASLGAAASNLFVGTYTAHVSVSNLSNGLLHHRSFTLKISDPLLILPAQGLEFAGPPSGPFNVASETCRLTNASQVAVSWKVVSYPPWLDVSPTNGVLDAYGTVGFRCSLNAAATNLAANTYATGLVLTNQTFASEETLPLVLLIGDLVQNGGFETGDWTDWTFTGSTDELYNSVSTNAIAVHSGEYGLELGETNILAYLSQTIPTIPGSSYSISLWLDSSDGIPTNAFSVAWGGETLFDATNLAAFGWTNLQFTVSASETNTELDIGSRDDNSYLGLDDISVRAAPPTFLGVTPSTAPSGGGTTVTISGAGFQTHVTVYFGSLAAASVTFVSVTNLTVVTPMVPSAGPVDVVITNADGQSALLSNGFLFTGFTPVPPVFQTAVVSAESVSFVWSTTPGVAYQVQSSSSLTAPNWTAVGGPIIATNTTARASDLITNSVRFYRVLLVPQ